MDVIGHISSPDFDADIAHVLKEPRTQIGNFDFSESLSSLDKLEALPSRQAKNEEGINDF